MEADVAVAELMENDYLGRRLFQRQTIMIDDDDRLSIYNARQPRNLKFGRDVKCS